MLFQSVSSILIVFCSKRVSHCFSVFILMSLFSWVFPKIGVPPNHPLQNRVFHYFQPSILGIPPFKETPSSIIKGKNTKLWHHRFLTSAKNRNIAFLFLWILIGNLRKPNKTTTFITPNNWLYGKSFPYENPTIHVGVPIPIVPFPWIGMGSLPGFDHLNGDWDLGVRDRREAVHPFRGLVLGGHLRRSLARSQQKWKCSSCLYKKIFKGYHFILYHTHIYIYIYVHIIHLWIFFWNHLTQLCVRYTSFWETQFCPQSLTQGLHSSFQLQV